MSDASYDVQGFPATHIKFAYSFNASITQQMNSTKKEVIDFTDDVFRCSTLKVTLLFPTHLSPKKVQGIATSQEIDLKGKARIASNSRFLGISALNTLHRSHTHVVLSLQGRESFGLYNRQQTNKSFTTNLSGFHRLK